jgi:plasmid stabilization system protein ParE
MGNRTISWSKIALRQFESAIKFIYLDSPVNAEKVSSDIIKQLSKAAKNPEFFPKDKYKKNNDGRYRAFENIAIG